MDRSLRIHLIMIVLLFLELPLVLSVVFLSISYCGTSLVIALGITLYVCNLSEPTGANILSVQLKNRNFTSHYPLHLYCL